MPREQKQPTYQELSQRVRALEETLLRVSAELESCGITTRLISAPTQDELLPELRSLTRRENEILWHLRRGKRVPSIARQLHISPSTVRNHLKSIFRKLDVGSQTELLDKLGGSSNA